MKTLRGYIDNRKKVLKELHESHWLDIDIHRLNELEQLDKFIYENIMID